MKASFEWNLPEEQQEFELYTNATRLHAACWDFADWLRRVCKYEDPKHYDAKACRDKLYEILKDHEYEL